MDGAGFHGPHGGRQVPSMMANDYQDNNHLNEDADSRRLDSLSLNDCVLDLSKEFGKVAVLSKQRQGFDREVNNNHHNNHNYHDVTIESYKS